MSNGEYLSLYNNYKLIYGSTMDITHRDFLDFLVENKLIESTLWEDVINKNNLIRVNDSDYVYINEDPFIDLPKTLNDKQYKAILDWLYYVLEHSNKKYVCVGYNGDHKSKVFDFISKNNENGYTPEDIIKEIKKFYL